MTQDGIPQLGSVTEQTHRIISSIENMLARENVTLDEIVRVQVWLSDMDHFAEFNEAYRTHFLNGFPARSVVTSQLAFGLDVEIEVQAVQTCPVC